MAVNFQNAFLTGKGGMNLSSSLFGGKGAAPAPARSPAKPVTPQIKPVAPAAATPSVKPPAVTPTPSMQPTAAAAPAMPQAPGIVPLTREPLNQTQQEALYGFTQAPSNALFTQAQNTAASALTPYNVSQADPYFNKYDTEALSYAIKEMKDAAAEREGVLKDRFANAGGYGSTAQGVENSRNQQQLTQDIGSLSANTRAQALRDAISASMGQHNTENNTKLTTANFLTGLGNTNRSNYYDDLNYKLSAGDRIQQENQSLLDLIENERLKGIQFPYGQLDFLGTQLGQRPTGQVTSGTSSGTPAWQAILGGGLLGSSIGKDIK